MTANSPEGLAETELQTSELISLIDSLNQRGFSSGAFRDAAALALQRRGKRDRGLPDGILLRLEGWLVDHPDPPLARREVEQQQKDEQRRGPILFGDNTISFLVGVTSWKPLLLVTSHGKRQISKIGHALLNRG